MPRLMVVLAAFLILGAACGTETETGGGGAASHETDEAAAGFGAEEVAFGSSLAQIRGHHLVALELYEAGEREAALTHAAHPIDEIVTSITTELEEHGATAGETLTSALEETRDLVHREAPADEVRRAVEDAAAATEQARDEFIGEAAASPSYQGSVIAALLTTAAHEYEEAVAGGKKVKLLDEYQDGYGFVTEAQRLYEEIGAEVEAASAEEAEEIEEAFEVLNDAFTSPQPPSKLTSVLDVESAAELIGHELEETVDAVPLEEADPEEVAEEIEELLGEIVQTYKAGDAEQAAELSAEAYLENYEVIEAEVIENAPEINAQLEPLLGRELRKRIQEGAPIEEIEAMVERAKELLADALEALEHTE